MEDEPEGGKVSASMAKAPLPRRPLRRVIPPTLTPQEIDRLIGEYLAKNNPKVEPAALTSDVEFVRRVYFDLTGKPPTPEQVALLRPRPGQGQAGHGSSTRCLQSPEYARNWARYWRDVIKFHATNENLLQVRFDALEDWLAKQFAEEPALGRDRLGD